MIVKTDLWGLWSPGIPGLGWVAGAVGLRQEDAKTLLADRRANGDAFWGECIREVELNVTLEEDGRVRGSAQATGKMALCD